MHCKGIHIQFKNRCICQSLVIKYKKSKNSVTHQLHGRYGIFYHLLKVTPYLPHCKGFFSHVSKPDLSHLKHITCIEIMTEVKDNIEGRKVY